MKRTVETESNTYIYDKEYRKYGKIGDEKLWKVYIKK